MQDAGGAVPEFGAMGVVYRGLRWPEIGSWLELARVRDLSPFWLRKIMYLSDVVAGERNRASDPSARAPYEP